MIVVVMKAISGFSVWAALAVAGFASAAAQTPVPPQGLSRDAAPAQGVGPVLQFAEPVHDFGKIKSGDVIKHTFAFTNAGTQTLEITDVRPQCGCTTAGDWSRKVEPGQSGTIPIQFNSANFAGTVMKSVTVTCNDPNHLTTTLQIKGTIWKPIDVTPTYVYMNPFIESPSNETRIVRIVSNLEEPIDLSDLHSSNPAFEADLKTVRPGKEFEMQITALAPFSATPVSGLVSVKTSSTNMPVINVTASLMPQQALSIIPNQITLPAGPLRTPMRPTVSIRYNGTNLLALSDATVNAQGAEVQLQTIQPGRLFSVVANFPAGFQIPPGEKVAVSLKSNHPQHPVITVPVYQSQTPVTRPLPSFIGPQIPQNRPVTNALRIPPVR
jgi:hypothetical protein